VSGGGENGIDGADEERRLSSTYLLKSVLQVKTGKTT
jgi:hypothetical protein